MVLKFVRLICLSLFCTLSAQKKLPFDSLKLSEVQDFFADDYGNFYLYKNRDFSFTKYDSLGRQHGQMMLAVPFKIQNVQNPLNIVLFSENTQEMKFIDQNLNEVQKIDLRKFGFIKMAFAEDLQQIWLLDESVKSLVQYNFREDKIIKSLSMNFSFDEVRDMLVYEDKVYLIFKNEIQVYNFKSEEKLSLPIENPLILRRENDRIVIISKNKIFLLTGTSLTTLFRAPSAEIVDKNSDAYFELTAGKLYLYRLQEDLKL